MTVQELVLQLSAEIDTVPDPGEPKDHVNNPVGVELPSVTVAVHDVVLPTATVLGLQDTKVDVGAAVIDMESVPKLVVKSLVPAKVAVIVVLPSPTVSPVIVTVHEFVMHASEEIEIVPLPGDP